MPTVAPHPNLQKPAPFSQASARARVPLSNITIKIKKKPPPLQLFAFSKKAGGDKPQMKMKKKKQQPPKPKPNKAQLKTAPGPNQALSVTSKCFIAPKTTELCLQRYGVLKSNTTFQAHTLLTIPANRSSWKLQQFKKRLRKCPTTRRSVARIVEKVCCAVTKGSSVHILWA
jgi:hypothetical protein